MPDYGFHNSSYAQPTTGFGFGTPGAQPTAGYGFATSRLGPGSVSNPLGKIQGFAISALEAFPELFGQEATPETQAFRAANPVSGFVSQFLGTGAFYGLAERGLLEIPQAARLIAGVGERFAPGWSRTAARIATQTGLVEAGRLGLTATGLPSAVTGRPRTESWGDLAGGAVVNTLAGGALGAVGGAISSRFAAGPRVFDLVPGAHPSQPLIMRVRSLDQATTALGADGTTPLFTDEQRMTFAHERDKLITANFTEREPVYNPTGNASIGQIDPETGQLVGVRRNIDVGRIVQPLAVEGPTRSGQLSASAWLNRMFNYDKTNLNRVTETRLLTVDPKQGFPSVPELNEVLGRIGRTRDELGLMGQNYRVVRVNTGVGSPGDPNAVTPFGKVGSADRAARSIEARFTGDNSAFTRAGNDWFLAREDGNGMWVGAKKIKGDLGVAAPGDEWFMGRFDSPDVLDPQAAAFRELTVTHSAYWPQPTTGKMVGVPAFDNLSQMELAFADFMHLPSKTRMVPGMIRAASNDVASMFANYLSPTSALASMNIRANIVQQMMKFATDTEGARVGNVMDGERFVPPGQTPLRQHVFNLEERRAAGGFRQETLARDRAAQADVQSALESELPIEMARKFAAAGKLHPDALGVLESLTRISDTRMKQFTDLKEGLNTSSGLALLEDFSPRRGHYGITRTRTGGFNAYIEDARTGEVAGWTGGVTQREARDAAMSIIQREFKENGRELRFGGMGDELLSTGDGWDRFTAAIRRPGFIRERGQLVGYDLQKKPLTWEDLNGLVERNLQSRERAMTNIVLHEKTNEPLHQLEQENPGLAVQMRKRLAILQGDEGNFAQFQNKTLDKVLSGVLGTNSASAIVRGTQVSLRALQFGFMNIANPVLNAVSIAQVILPEMAFAMRHAGRDLTDYITLPRTNEQGHPIGAVSMLSDIKMMGSVFRLMGTNERHLPQDYKDVLQMAADQRLIAPRYAEQEPGGTGSLLKRAFEGKNRNLNDWMQTLGAANEIMMAKTEELNRLVSVTAAYRVGKNAGITDPFMMHRFVRDFVGKTAFNYSTVDRPTVFTTPLGSLAGTFKTWMFHYMANMAKYASEAGQGNLAPLLWQTATTAAIAGGVGTPMFMPIANGLSQFFANKPATDLLYNDVFHDHHQLADGVLYGLPGLFGVSMAASAGSPGADPVRDAQMLFSFAALDRAKAMGSAAAGAWEGYRVSGQSPWENDVVRDQMIRAFAPRTIYRAVSVAEDHAIRSMATGYRVMDNVSLGSGLLYAAGFNPAQLDTTYHAYSELRHDQVARRAATTDLGRALSEAWQDNDSHLANRVYMRGLAMGLPMESVLRSARARQERAQQTQLGYALGGHPSPTDAQWQWLDPGDEATQAGGPLVGTTSTAPGQ